MLTNKKTKIVATLGPACSTREIIKEVEKPIIKEVII